MKQVTTWADTGITPDLKSGRWVQLGKPSPVNYYLTGLPGGKMYFIDTFPFIKYEKNKTEFKNHVTMHVNDDQLEFPRGMGVDGFIKGLFGQRRIK